MKLNKSQADDIEIAVIGAGVVGLSVAKFLAEQGHDVILLEEQNMIGTITSSRNSGVIHAGIYYPTNSLKARFCVQGKDMLYSYAKAHGIPHKRCGKIIAATDKAQLSTLEKLHKQAKINHVLDLEFLSAEEARALEPELSCIAALLSPSSGLIDQHILMHELLGDTQNAGAILAVNSPVESGEIENDKIYLWIGGPNPSMLRAHFVVNSAGLSAQKVARSILGIPSKTIPEQVLAKGNYFVATGKAPFSRLIYPVPIEGGLGAHATTDLGGQARFGPDVEWVDDVTDYNVNPERAASFYKSIRQFWPGLQDGQLHPSYAGIRPKLSKSGSAESDFVIQTSKTHGIAGLINLYGIESPGLTSSLAIGDYVASLI